MIKILNSVICL
jgi:hypothetical protein